MYPVLYIYLQGVTYLYEIKQKVPRQVYWLGMVTETSELLWNMG